MEGSAASTVQANGRTGRRHSVGSKLWKQLRLSTRKNKSKSFVAYCTNDENSDVEGSYISEPTNFHRNEYRRENFLFDHNSIQDCPFDVSGYGKLLKKDKFKLKKPKRKKLVVFLFEKVIILTTEHNKEKESSYYYYASIKIGDLSLAPLSSNKRKILLKDFTNSKYSKNEIEYKLEAKTEDMQNIWREIIQKCLWLQLLSAKDHPDV